MARPTYGPQAQKRAKRLFEALIAYANYELEDVEHIPIRVNWQTEKRLVIKAKVRFLQALTAQDNYEDKLTGDQIKEALKRFQDFMEILEDNRAATQGAEDWHFTLNLWYRRQETAANLRQFDLEWERRRPLKSRQARSETASLLIDPPKALELIDPPEAPDRQQTSRLTQQDWGEALDVSAFYGRDSELAVLKAWAVEEGCRLIMLVGMGGIGKTALSIKLAEQIQEEFEYVIWRSLRNAPPVEDLIADFIDFLSNHQISSLPAPLDGRISMLLKHLRDARCLLVLDNAESILQTDQRAGRYKTGYEGYGQLLKSIGETHHRSCLILTSREKPQELSTRAGKGLPIRSFKLEGLMQAQAEEILKDKGFQVSAAEGRSLVSHYAGNPLALKIVATTIQEVFAGNVSLFLSQGITIFGDISDLLEQQFNRLSVLEKAVMYWLAIHREWMSLSELQQDLVPSVPRRSLLEALESLQLRSLIDSSLSPKQQCMSFTQQPVVMEYVTNQFIEQIYDEITQVKLALFSSHALIKAQAKDYLRATQIRLILQPLAKMLWTQLGGREAVQQSLQQVLSTLRLQPPRQAGYGAGNLLNLLGQLNFPISNFDFSNLAIWQAYLGGIHLCRVNFANADLSRSVFTQTLGSLFSATFSPDGGLLATGLDHEVCIWQIADYRPILTLRGHTAWVQSLSFSPDGRVLASGSYDQTIRLWDVQTGQCLKTLRGHEGPVQSLSFSPDGRSLVSGGHDQTIRVWGVESWECLLALRGHQGRVLSVSFICDGKTLVSSGDDQTVRLWNIHSGECCKAYPIAVNWALAIALSPDGQMLVTGSDRTVVKVWNLETGDCVQVLDYRSEVWAVAFSPDGKVVATASEDQTVKLWNVETGHCLQTYQAHTQRVWLATFSPDAKTLVSISDDQTLKFWEVETGKCVRSLDGYSNSVLAIALSSDGKILASSGEDRQVRLWHLETGECFKVLQGHADLVSAIAFVPSVQKPFDLATGSDDQTLKLWDYQTGECLCTLRGHQGWVHAVSVSPDSNLLVSGGQDQMVRIWDSETGECLQTLQGHTHRVKSVAFSPDGARVASGSDDQTVNIWQVATGQCLQTLCGHEGFVLTVVFSSCGRWLASGSADQTIRLWDAATGQHLQTLRGHTHRVRAIAFSPNGEWLVSGGDDQTVRLWSVKTGECLKVLEGHTKTVWSVTVHPTAQMVISGGEDELIQVWSMETGKCIKTLRIARPYEAMNIKGAIGLTTAQRATLKALGAIEAG